MTDAISAMIATILDEVNALSAPGPGYTRPSYSPLESAAHGVIERHLERLGLQVWRDAALNLFARLPGRDRTAPALHVGSHLDTVAMGGAYDGAAGVAGAMALLASYIHEGTAPPVDLVLTVTRAEESVWFPVSYIGSRAALGRLSAEELAAPRSDSGRSLADHMRAEGGDPDAVPGAAGLPRARFLEMHIEQGPVLFEAGEPFAAVTDIRGGLRYRTAEILGTWAHSGGAPRESRSDTVFALADLVTAMDRHWGATLAAGQDLAVTFGRVDAASPEHAFAKVPGRLAFCVDLRSSDPAALEAADAALQAEIARIQTARRLRFDLGAPSRSQPTALDPAMVRMIVDGAAAGGRNLRTMASGGGHDAAAFALAGWPAAMIFLRNWNGSHNPEEGMDPADLALAVQALRAGLDRSAGVAR